LAYTFPYAIGQAGPGGTKQLPLSNPGCAAQTEAIRLSNAGCVERSVTLQKGGGGRGRGGGGGRGGGDAGLIGGTQGAGVRDGGL
jgi:hypothetical protein